MSVRPPRALAASSRLPESPLAAALEREVLEEKVATYVRLVQKLEAALEEARSAEGATGTEKERLLDAAGEALWYVTIQRDLCGFLQHDLFYRDMNVPEAVRLRMGLVKSR